MHFIYVTSHLKGQSFKLCKCRNLQKKKKKENCVFVYNCDRYSLSICTEQVCMITAYVNIYCMCMYTAASLSQSVLSTTPVAASLTHNIAGSSSDPLVLLETCPCSSHASYEACQLLASVSPQIRKCKAAMQSFCF